MSEQEPEQPMPPIVTKAAFWGKVERLNPRLQQTVVMFIDTLLETQPVVEQSDKHRLLNIPTWSAADIQLVEEAQWQRNRQD